MELEADLAERECAKVPQPLAATRAWSSVAQAHRRHSWIPMAWDDPAGGPSDRLLATGAASAQLSLPTAVNDNLLGEDGYHRASPRGRTGPVGKIDAMPPLSAMWTRRVSRLESLRYLPVRRVRRVPHVAGRLRVATARLLGLLGYEPSPPGPSGEAGG
jgi:hypothetical protein